MRTVTYKLAVLLCLLSIWLTCSVGNVHAQIITLPQGPFPTLQAAGDWYNANRMRPGDAYIDYYDQDGWGGRGPGYYVLGEGRIFFPRGPYPDWSAAMAFQITSRNEGTTRIVYYENGWGGRGPGLYVLAGR